MKKFVNVLLVNIFVCTLALSGLTFHAIAQTDQKLDPQEKFLKTENPIFNRYIVVLKDQDTEFKNNQSQARVRFVADSLAAAYGGMVEHVYNSALTGFSVELSETEALALSRNPQVKYVVEDGVAYPSETQYNAPWGLDRVDQRDLPLSTTYNYTATGAGVRAYVIDSGILPSHAEFGGRATAGADFIGDGQNGVDCNGHGTHVSGILAGNTYGVAKQASVIGVRVFPCAGGSAWSTIIAGVDWVRTNAVRPAVTNMSLGGGANQAIDDAVRNLINSGITVVVAAGNGYGSDANFTSPARVREAITVGASNINDVRADFSNIGSALDLFAPGESIISAWYTSNTATATLSGTSMAAPHVAGVAALYLQNNTSASPTLIGNAIINAATPNRLTNIGAGSPNLLLHLIPNSESPIMDPRVFDAQWYLDLNPDVAAAYGSNNLAGARYHWEVAGINEGRISSPAFHVREYLVRYPDLQAAFGTNYRAAIDHWLNQGLRNEGRRASPAFDAPYYLNRYIDLRNAFGPTGYEAALNHWLNQGLINEARQGSVEFDPQYYLANNPDVAAAYGATNYRGGLTHWLVSGRSEGRLGAP